MADERALEQLRTVQLLESTVGPKSIRQLENVLAERSRELLVRIEEDSRRHRALLETVITEWAALARPAAKQAPQPESRLSHEEMLSSFIELKESQAEVLRRAAASAPTDHIKQVLAQVADREEATATALKELLPREG